MTAITWQVLARIADAGPFLTSCAPQDPFAHPDFLLALESSGCLDDGSGWQACHLLFMQEQQPAALLPLYRKAHSQGEYVFDQGWAAGYQRAGLAYYPKLLTAIPFTPVPGPRLLLTGTSTEAEWRQAALHAVKALCQQSGISSWHGLFVDADWQSDGIAAGMAIREGCRFHWQNPGFGHFEDFLATLTSKKRKDIRRERRLLAEAGLRYRHMTGDAISPADWDFFWRCYQQTYFEHGQRPYLNREFFRQIAHSLSAHLLLVIAEDTDGPMASALFFQFGHTLYGRYWGCLRRADGLHFELCYYQGMEFCIRHGLSDFDPGTQGEHKLLRGFSPRLTYSVHWLQDPGFRHAVETFLEEEREHVRRYRDEAETLLPYRQTEK